MKIKVVAHLILRALANLANLEEDYFVKEFGDRANLYARFNYYPPCSQPDLVLGIKSHSDGCAITILLQDNSVDGLEVFKDGKWIKIPAIPHALLVNIGDQLEIMSNGIFKSPVHRAVTNSEKERMSVAMFYAPEMEKEIGPADGLVDNGRSTLYQKMKVKEYIDLYDQYYSQGKRAIDVAKV
ncbi:protein SRG1-like [Magnolia sinica]|uniref:protein SRG1-like n=1 Tax=Magnolia sinica TaxID=86752 RepID=UPI00265AAB08|nr:protein SRG1-like [Magnolia sinica]